MPWSGVVIRFDGKSVPGNITENQEGEFCLAWFDDTVRPSRVCGITEWLTTGAILKLKQWVGLWIK